MIPEKQVDNTQEQRIAVKWKMLQGRKTFTAEYEGYFLTVTIGTALAPRWSIVKDRVIVDECFYHSPTKDELSARVQAERCLYKIIEKALQDYNQNK